MDKYNESEIVSQLQNPATQRKAFEAIVNQFGRTLYWQIRRMVIEHDDADDVLQNTFIKAWTNIESFKGNSKIYTWINKIAYNESLTFLAHKRENISIEQSDTGLAERLESDPYFDGDETQVLLLKAIATLPDKQKAVFNMKYFQEMKYEDMSQVFGTSIGALKASYHLAVKKIEEFFSRYN